MTKNNPQIVPPTTVGITYTIPNMMMVKIAKEEAVAAVLRAVNAAYYMGAIS